MPRDNARRPRIADETGSLALLLLGGLALLLLLGFFGYTYLRTTGERLVESAETVDRGIRHLTGLEYMHPFTPPGDGVVGEDRAALFATVTIEAHADMEGGLTRLDELDTGDDRPSLRAMAEGIGALGDVTLSLGQSLSRYDMPLSEYLWTGFQLLRGAGHVERIWRAEGMLSEPGLAELAGRHREVLDEILHAVADSASGDGPGVVYWMGWGMASQSAVVWQSPAVQETAAFIDTLPLRQPRHD